MFKGSAILLNRVKNAAAPPIPSGAAPDSLTEYPKFSRRSFYTQFRSTALPLLHFFYFYNFIEYFSIRTAKTIIQSV